MCSVVQKIAQVLDQIVAPDNARGTGGTMHLTYLRITNACNSPFKAKPALSSGTSAGPLGRCVLGSGRAAANLRPPFVSSIQIPYMAVSEPTVTCRKLER